MKNFDGTTRKFATLFILLLALYGCGPQSHTGNSPMTQGNNQPASSTITGVFTSIYMMTTNIGWATAQHTDNNGNSYVTILRTTDSGVHWKEVLTCKPYAMIVLGAGIGVPTNFYSASVATVSITEYDSATQQYQSRIVHTSDGGQTWQSSIISAILLETPPLFIDALHGWVFATDHFPGPDRGSAYIGQEIALFHTSNGGHTWQKIAHGPSTSQPGTTSDDAYGVVPLTASTRMNFTSPTTGWMSSTSYRNPQSSFSWLYVTHDAGATWQQVQLSFPDSALVTWSPTFFNDQEGFLPVLTSGPAPQYTRGTLLYNTRDGGATWVGVTVPFDVTNAATIDANHAWAQTDDSNAKTFYATSDDWRHWTKGQIHTTFLNIYGFDFISPHVGWALADNIHRMPEPGGGLRPGDVVALLKTTDGGQTWQEIAQSHL